MIVTCSTDTTIPQSRVAKAAAPADGTVHRDLLRLEASRDRLRSYWLECAGQPIAFQIGAACDGIYNLLSTAFLPEDAAFLPGQVLLVHVIEDLRQARIGSIDYGFVDGLYKRMYGTENWEEVTVHLYAKNIRASSARVVHRVAVGLHRRASVALARGGLLARVKKQWRSRLARGRNSSTMARGRK